MEDKKVLGKSLQELIIENSQEEIKGLHLNQDLLEILLKMRKKIQVEPKH